MATNFTTMDPRIVELSGKAISAPINQIQTDKTGLYLDESWAKTAFLISDNKFTDNIDVKNRYWSSANIKFTDGRLGCNIGINPRPQFTRYSDVRTGGRKADRKEVSLGNVSGNYGMGRYYSEAIDDPAQTVYLRFGVPQFNSLMSFMTTAFSADLTSLARTGRAKSAFYDVAKLGGTITTAIAFPAVAATVMAGRLLGWIFSRPTTKFYTMKPTMHLYWSTVNMLVNNLAVNRGIFPKILNDTALGNGNNPDQGKRLGRPYTFDNEQLQLLSKLMPDVFRDGSYFDMYALANRAQRIANQVFHEDYEKLNNGSATDFEGYLKKEMTGNGTHSTYISKPNGEATISAFLNRMSSLDYWFNREDSSKMEQDPRVDPNAKNDGTDKPRDPSYYDSFVQHFDAEFRDGSQFAIFKVDHTGSVQESFGNSLQESSISEKINEVSSQMKNARFSFAEGNLVGGPAGTAVNAVAGAARDVVEGALDGLTLGFSGILKGLLGSGYVDIPKHWQSSTATLPKSSYTMQLISPYGNVISQMQNIYIPLSMILAGALPLSTGKQSYTSPFLCQLYDRGRCQVKLGMIESLSITRGTSNLAFSTKGVPMAIDVNFTIVDLSSIMHMPISTNGIFQYDAGLDEDNILSDYLAVLAGQDLYSQLYALPKAKLRIAKTLMNAKKLSSPAYWASSVHYSMSSGMINDLTLGASGVITNVIEGVNRGSVAADGPLGPN